MASASPKNKDDDYDCDAIVIGGGPAGSAAASWLAMSGRRVIMLERDHFPRFHIGESLLASVNDVFAQIGADAVIREAGFPPKWGATFMSADGRIERCADFGVAPGVPAPQTWQVPRATFDDILLRHASTCGADVRQGHRVLDVMFGESSVTANVHATGSRSYNLRAPAVIDASGRGALLSRKLNLRVHEPRLANVAIFAHYSGVLRRSGRRAGDIRIVAREDCGWFWLIPISDELTSVGVVLPRGAADRFTKCDRLEWLDRAIAETPVVARLLADARQEWPVRIEKDFSFRSRRYVGKRWLLTGDAGSFLDPVFSTGVAIALESGLEAGQAVQRCLDEDDWSGRLLRRYARRQQARYRSFRRFVLGFYTSEFRDVFFAEDPPRQLFRSVVSVFAGYWNPGLRVRAWVALFFLLVRLQRHLKFMPHYDAIRELQRDDARSKI